MKVFIVQFTEVNSCLSVVTGVLHTTFTNCAVWKCAWCLFPFLSKCASLTYLDDVHVCRAAGHRLIHLPHLPIGLHSNHFNRHREAPPCENGCVHHLYVLKMQERAKKV